LNSENNLRQVEFVFNHHTASKEMEIKRSINEAFFIISNFMDYFKLTEKYSIDELLTKIEAYDDFIEYMNAIENYYSWHCTYNIRYPACIIRKTMLCISPDSFKLYKPGNICNNNYTQSIAYEIAYKLFNKILATSKEPANTYPPEWLLKGFCAYASGERFRGVFIFTRIKTIISEECCNNIFDCLMTFEYYLKFAPPELLVQKSSQSFFLQWLKNLKSPHD